MKRNDLQEDPKKKISASIAIVHDIIKRHTKVELTMTTRDEKCEFCSRHIPKDTHAASIKNFRGNIKIFLCSQECTDAHVWREIKLFDCKEVGNIQSSEFEHKEVSKATLDRYYRKRLAANIFMSSKKMSDFCDLFQDLITSYE